MGYHTYSCRGTAVTVFIIHQLDTHIMGKKGIGQSLVKSLVSLVRGKKTSSNGRHRAPSSPVSIYNQGTYNGKKVAVSNTDINTKLKRFDGVSFECAAANLLASMGYKIMKGFDSRRNIMNGPTAGDAGVDIRCRKGDKVLIVQCKHTQKPIGRPEIQQAVGANDTNRGGKVLVISTGGFTEQAKEYAQRANTYVILWDWNKLEMLMCEHLMIFTPTRPNNILRGHSGPPNNRHHKNINHRTQNHRTSDRRTPKRTGRHR